MWVRGLKLRYPYWQARFLWVAPYVGAWIETIDLGEVQNKYKVAPYVGAWIETTAKA